MNTILIRAERALEKPATLMMLVLGITIAIAFARLGA